MCYAVCSFRLIKSTVDNACLIRAIRRRISGLRKNQPKSEISDEIGWFAQIVLQSGRPDKIK